MWHLFFFDDFEKSFIFVTILQKKRKINLEISKIMINTHTHTHTQLDLQISPLNVFFRGYSHIYREISNA